MPGARRRGLEAVRFLTQRTLGCKSLQKACSPASAPGIRLEQGSSGCVCPDFRDVPRSQEMITGQRDLQVSECCSLQTYWQKDAL